MPIGSPTAMRTAPRRSSDSGYYAVAKHKKMQGLLRSASSPALTPEPAPPLAPEQPRNPIAVLFSILAGSSGVAAPDSPSQAEGCVVQQLLAAADEAKKEHGLRYSEGEIFIRARTAATYNYLTVLWDGAKKCRVFETHAAARSLRMPKEAF